jgi:hypothetical protein
MKWARALTYRKHLGKLHIVDESSGTRRAHCRKSTELSRHDWPEGQLKRAQDEDFICRKCEADAGLERPGGKGN